MKILLFSSSTVATRLLKEEIEKTGHLVVETVEDSDLLIFAILRTTPHLLIAHTSEKSDFCRFICLQAEELFPDLTVCAVRDDLSKQPSTSKSTIKKCLAQPIKPFTPRPYANGNRNIGHDPALQRHWKGKLNSPGEKEGWEKVCSNQETRFVLQLQTGMQNHAAAKRYYECLLAQQPGIDQELAYRFPHGSYKALSWSRDLAAKWLGLLAHYSTGVELEYLPIPQTPGPAIDYVREKMSVEGIYAATCVILAGIKPSIVTAIREIMVTKFTGQDDDTLLAESVKLYGFAKFLEQVGKAHVKLMDSWLDPAIVRPLEFSDVPRDEHRDTGIVRDFYDLTYILDSPATLASILARFHAGTTYVKSPRTIPSFAEVLRLSREKSSPQGANKTSRKRNPLNNDRHRTRNQPSN